MLHSRYFPNTRSHSRNPVLRTRNLLRLPVYAVHAAARAELLQLQPVRVVALVLRAGVVAVLALGASQVDYDAVGFLCHLLFLLVLT